MTTTMKWVLALIIVHAAVGVCVVVFGWASLQMLFSGLTIACTLAVISTEIARRLFGKLKHARFSLQKLMLVMLWGCSGVSCVIAKNRLAQALGFFALAALVAYLIVGFMLIRVPFERVRRDK